MHVIHRYGNGKGNKTWCGKEKKQGWWMTSNYPMTVGLVKAQPTECRPCKVCWPGIKIK